MKMNDTVKNMKNPYVEVLYWIKGERLDIKAMNDSIDRIDRLKDIKEKTYQSFKRSPSKSATQSFRSVTS
jgi:hypothetical protein